jgi:hypothetical protein
VSDRDIPAGVLWSSEITANLQAATAGIICVTPENQMEPWVLFEAGALANRLGTGSKVCVYLIGMTRADLAQGPLTLYQLTEAKKVDTLQLLHSLNDSLHDSQLPEDILARSFERCWPELEQKLREVVSEPVDIPTRRRQPDELLDEMLVELRRVGRQNETVLNAVRSIRAVESDATLSSSETTRSAEDFGNALVDRLRAAATPVPELLEALNRSTIALGRYGANISTRSAADYQILLKHRRILEDVHPPNEFAIKIFSLAENIGGA